MFVFFNKINDIILLSYIVWGLSFVNLKGQDVRIIPGEVELFLEKNELSKWKDRKSQVVADTWLR